MPNTRPSSESHPPQSGVPIVTLNFRSSKKRPPPPKKMASSSRSAPTLTGWAAVGAVATGLAATAAAAWVWRRATAAPAAGSGRHTAVIAAIGTANPAHAGSNEEFREVVRWAAGARARARGWGGGEVGGCPSSAV